MLPQRSHTPGPKQSVACGRCTTCYGTEHQPESPAAQPRAKRVHRQPAQAQPAHARRGGLHACIRWWRGAHRPLVSGRRVQPVCCRGTGTARGKQRRSQAALCLAATICKQVRAAQSRQHGTWYTLGSKKCGEDAAGMPWQAASSTPHALKRTVACAPQTQTQREGRTMAAQAGLSAACGLGWRRAVQKAGRRGETKPGLPPPLRLAAAAAASTLLAPAVMCWWVQRCPGLPRAAARRWSRAHRSGTPGCRAPGDGTRCWRPSSRWWSRPGAAHAACPHDVPVLPLCSPPA